jgi:U11-48K-like CHHC zinc finger
VYRLKVHVHHEALCYSSSASNAQSRYCSQPRKPDSEYCGIHYGDIFEGSSRMPCPVDPSHTIERRTLNAHLAICQRAKEVQDVEAQPYYSQGINSGTALCDGDDSVLHEAAVSLQMAKASGERASGVYLDELVQRIEQAYDDHIGSMPVVQLNPAECLPLQTDATAVGTHFTKMRHIMQQCSMIGHMQQAGLVGPGTDNCYIEMGAGMLYYLHIVATLVTCYKSLKTTTDILYQMCCAVIVADTSECKTNLML